MNKPCRYSILKGEMVRKANSWKEYEEFCGDFENNIRLARDFVIPTNAFVSTIFLPTDANCGIGSPLHFESRIFSSCSLDGMKEHYPTYESAMTGHRKMLEILTIATLYFHKIYPQKKETP